MAFNLFPQIDFRQMDLNYVLEVSKQAAANLEEYAADKEQVVATQAAAEQALAAAQEDIQTARAAAASAEQDAQTASTAAGTATQAAASASTDAQTASEAAETAQEVAESIPADYSQLSQDVDNLKSDLNDISPIFEDYFETEEYTVSDTLTWTDNKYYDINTGTISTQAGYSLTNKNTCQSGDIITVPTNTGQILFWGATDYISYKATSPSQETTAVAPEGAEYYALNNRDSDVRAASCSRVYHRNVITQTMFNAPARPIYDSSYFVNEQYISTVNGRIYTGDSYATWYSAYALSCKAEHNYRTSTNAQAVFYDSSMHFLSAYIPAITGTDTTGIKLESDFTTPANCAYMSINSKVENEVIYDLERVMYGSPLNSPRLIGKTVVCFGDSITGNYQFGDNYPYQIEESTGAKTYNVGFGGCRMDLTTETSIAYVNPFSMVSLADAIVSTATDKWSTQDEAASSFGSFSARSLIRGRLAILKSLDFANVDIVTIAYGTNGIGRPLDDAENPLNTYTYAGATRYAIKTLLERYPHLRIVLLTPIYRWYNATSDDSDTHQISGQTLLDRVEKLIEVGQETKIPTIDLYHTLGINKYNHTGFFGDDDESADGTHINSFGREQMGLRIAGELNRLF